MIRRILAAIAVLSGTIYWADCSFPGTGVDGGQYFEGCFQGPVNEPAGLGNVTIVLTHVGTGERNGAMVGCLRMEPSLGTVENGTIAGEMEVANGPELTVAVTPAGTEFELLVVRQPSGLFNANALTLNNLSGTLPFMQAANLPRSCPTETTCQTLGFPMPFMPGGGTP